MMVDHSDVVVVGGGIMGMSLALHLLELGAGTVRVVERDTVFSGTTAAGGGFLARWTAVSPLHGAGALTIPLEDYGVDFYEELGRHHQIGWGRPGLIWICGTEEAWKGAQEIIWHAVDPDSRAIDGAEVERLTGGLVGPAGYAGAQWLPGAAQIHAPSVGAALEERVLALGGIVDSRRPVTGVRTSGGRVMGVDTTRGPIAAGVVVAAAGAWNNQLLAPLGAFLPTIPQITSRLITDRRGVPESFPILMLQAIMPGEPGGGAALWVRAHAGGLLWGGMYTTHPRNAFVHAPLPERLDELDMDGVLEDQRVAAAAAPFFPALAGGTYRVKHGAPCYTPDNVALVGALPQAEGLYAMAGDNEVGVTHGPGFGRALAERIVNGRSSLVDLDHWRPDRFGDEYSTPALVQEAVQSLLVEERH